MEETIYPESVMTCNLRQGMFRQGGDIPPQKRRHFHDACYLGHLHPKLSSAHRPDLHCCVCLRPNLTPYCRDKMKPLLPCDRKPRDLLLGFLLVLACRGLACPCQNLREQIFALLLVVASVSLLLTAGLCLQVLTKPRMNVLQAQIAP